MANGCLYALLVTFGVSAIARRFFQTCIIISLLFIDYLKKEGEMPAAIY